MLPAMEDRDGKEQLPTRAKTERLETRVQPEVKELIERAAARLGTTVSEFVLRSSVEHALDVVERLETARLNREQSAAFTEALVNPPAPSPALVAAMLEHRTSFHGRR